MPASERAIQQFEDAIEYIEKDSVANSEKFKRDILQKIDRLLTYPENYSLDKYKLNNDGTFRAFEIHRYRISYRYKKNEVRIIRVRHTKMNPLSY